MTEIRHIHIAGTLAEARAAIDGYWEEILAAVPGTRLAAIRDPLRHIIRPAVDLQPIGILAGMDTRFWNGRFYADFLNTYSSPTYVHNLWLPEHLSCSPSENADSEEVCGRHCCEPEDIRGITVWFRHRITGHIILSSCR